ncbi:hypothetical protein PIB30_075529 [Stylosanthes scabra]|uniref:Uncharacterized protein n=1 Tax=Stylosanthes scabra TaxID=79078 RepID=A0ABU6QQ58_9FABA|nr:hypothetical protein [Stylosanthes scabra]
MSWWSGGFRYGLWIGILVASGFSVVLVLSFTWKSYNQNLKTLEIGPQRRRETFDDLFLTKLSLLLKGTVVAPPDKFGETLQD